MVARVGIAQVARVGNVAEVARVGIARGGKSKGAQVARVGIVARECAGWKKSTSRHLRVARVGAGMLREPAAREGRPARASPTALDAQASPANVLRHPAYACVYCLLLFRYASSKPGILPVRPHYVRPCPVARFTRYAPGAAAASVPLGICACGGVRAASTFSYATRECYAGIRAPGNGIAFRPALKRHGRPGKRASAAVAPEGNCVGPLPNSGSRSAKPPRRGDETQRSQKNSPSD